MARVGSPRPLPRLYPFPGLQDLGCWVLVLGGASLAPPGADRGDVGLIANLLGAIGAGGQLDEGMKGNVHPGALSLVLLHEVSVDAAQNGLVSDDENVFTSLQFHNNRLKADDDVAIRLSATVAVVVLVFITSSKVLGISVLDLLVSQTVTHARVKLVKGLPLELVVVLRKEARCGDGSSKGRGPHGKRTIILKVVLAFAPVVGISWWTYSDRLSDELREFPSILLATRRKERVTADSPIKVVQRFTVLHEVSLGP